MPDFKWRKIENADRPMYLSESDYCVYAREHTDGGYEASHSNQMLFNYKKPLEYKGTGQWFYKIHSITLFATELSQLNFPNNSVLIPAPTSKPRSSVLFDSRIDDSINELIKYRPDLKLQPILDMSEEIRSAHSEGGPRDPSIIEQYITVSNFTGIDIPDKVFIIDDIITTGGHFKAAKNAILKHFPQINVIGVFWAKHIFDDNN